MNQLWSQVLWECQGIYIYKHTVKKNIIEGRAYLLYFYRKLYECQ